VDTDGLALAQLPRRGDRSAAWVPDLAPACVACGSTRAPAFRVVYDGNPNRWVALCRSYAGCSQRQLAAERARAMTPNPTWTRTW